MQISVDPDATLQVASKTDQALARLEATFDICDNATATVAALLANGAPAVAASVRDVAAREGGHRTKAFAQAHAANGSLRDAVGDFVRFGEDAVEELERIRRSAESVFEYGVDKFQQGVDEVRRFGEGVIDGARDVGEDIVDGARDVAEDVAEGARDLAEDAVDTAHDIADTLSDLSKRRGIFDL